MKLSSRTKMILTVLGIVIVTLKFRNEITDLLSRVPVVGPAIV